MRCSRVFTFAILVLLLMAGLQHSPAQAQSGTFLTIYSVSSTSCTPGFNLKYNFSFAVAATDSSSHIWSVTNLRTGVTTAPSTVGPIPGPVSDSFSSDSSGTPGSAVPAGTLPGDMLRQDVVVTSTLGPNTTASITFNCSGTPSLASDGRINPDPQATLVGYCMKHTKGIEVYSPKGVLLFRVEDKQIDQALKKAVDGGKHVLIKQAAGQQLWALKSNELQFHNALGEEYDYIFAADRCG